jgi:hypothetical protein
MSELHTEITKEDKLTALRKQLIREFAAQGGKARYANMSPEERKAHMKALQAKRSPDWKENLAMKAKIRWAKIREMEALENEAKGFAEPNTDTTAS